VESDYCYILTAADRLYDGHGPTATPPVAPNQPWTWQADWTFLTKWPIGYSILIVAVRRAFDLPTLDACRWISVSACALALVGWFVWVRRNIPLGHSSVCAGLLAAVASACAVSTSWLVDPSTDLLLVAAMPFVFLAAWRGFEPPITGTPTRIAASSPAFDAGGRPRGRTARSQTSLLWLAIAGLLAGGLFWFRYASVFVPAGIGAFLLIERYRRRIGPGAVAVFATSAALPIAALLLINGTFGPTDGMQAQLNLGHTAQLDLSPDLLARAWWGLTALGFYDHHPLAHWILALWPVALIVGAFAFQPARTAARSFLASPGITMSACVLLMMLIMLIAATALFGDKFDYVGLDRYYIPGRPIYFLLFATPVLMIPRRWTRGLAAVALLIACSWIVGQDWARPYKRWQVTRHEKTPYGQWSVPFGAGAEDLYPWLAGRAAPELVVVSNFHEYLTLETRMPALPVPQDVPTLKTWIDRIRAARETDDVRVLFVLDPDNRWRDYWMPSPSEVVELFSLRPEPSFPPTPAAHVYAFDLDG
jgi:hypothetical protein